MGSEVGTLRRLGLQVLVEKGHLRGQSRTAAGEKGGHNKWWMDGSNDGVTGGSC